MRGVLGIACVSLTLVLTATAQVPAVEEGRVALRDLVPPGDPLAAQDLGIDASSACLALESLRTHDSAVAIHLAESPAITHILHHARNFDYDVPKESRAALVSSLLAPRDREAERSATCRQSLTYLGETMLADPRWVGDALRYLPAGFRFHGTLFLTFGYDIGVALAPNASLNCTHPHFDGHPRELLYYAIHELHHVGFMTFQTPPRLADITSCSDLLRLVEYSTQMEGMAVLAAYQRRRDDHALADDNDYVALEDAKRMEADLASYLEDYAYLKGRGAQPADSRAWQVIDRMASGERLWYRVGASMAQRIEASTGRDALVALVKRGPAEFIRTYASLSSSPPHCEERPTRAPTK
ncbi:MAG: DUF5700 domain-containing putative Zn-dependent protease [Acidobacteriota bacterium]